jgi:hypothetical protein
LLADRDPEEARQLLDPVLERMMPAVHCHQEYVTKFLGSGYLPYLALRLRTKIIAVMRWRRCCASKRRASGMPSSQRGRSV